MAGNRKIFEEAAQAAANAAWDQDWEKSITEYKRALAEFPKDANALMGLGQAYYGAGQLKPALTAYQQASEVTPSDPVLLERIGQTREQLGEGKPAADAYMASAGQYLSQQQAAHLALDRWKDAVRACPDCVQAHAKLLQYYQENGQIKEAVNECMALAHIYQDCGQIDYATQICQHALKLSPRDTGLLRTYDTLRYSEQAAAEPEASKGAPGLFESFGESVDLDFTAPEAETAEIRGSPVAIARQKALTDLAESFFEDEDSVEIAPPPAGDQVRQLSKAETDGLLGRAIDLQTRGEVDQAIDAYEQVVAAGIDQPAVHFNLGLLYQEKLRFDAAISQFERSIAYSDYALGSHFALGECHRAKGRIDEALEHFIEVLKIVDLATVERDQADDLIQLYEHLTDGYVAKGDRDQALEFTNSLVTFLSEQGWEDKVFQARQRLDTLAEEGPTLSLAEMLATSGAEDILESVALAQEYTKRSMFYAALEECYSTLRRAPTYLPTHRQLGQVLLAMGKVEEAVAKFVAIAHTYLAHGNVGRAVGMYNRVLKLAPMDTTVRAKLIDILVSHGKIEEALDHYLVLAESYYNQAQMDRAREVYQEALRLAPRGDPGRRWPVRILHKIGDIDMQRVDWKRAVGIYEQIRKVAPDDERARLTLMGLYHRLGRPELAIAEMDDLLKSHRERGRMERVFTILEDAVNERPDDIPLRTRLAQVHLDAGNVDQALLHLDKLGDLQMNAGRTEDAKATIRAIIALNPPNVDAYKQLLAQIGG
ncbi:MAG: tetratricopeptide repeat protein [Anaerolineae bacterium]|nr:tetratricopeptide repeat protein [Anaerolineae bacterium]